MRRNQSYQMAMGGLMAALAVTLMCMGTLIPVATFVCPMLCMLLLQLVIRLCGRRVGWAWYGAVAILSLLMAPDKEAAAVFAFLGYYPILKPKMDRMKLSFVWKAVLFNTMILAMYWLLMHLFGMEQLTQEFREAGTVLTIVMLLLGNVTFFLLDKLLEKKLFR